MASASAEKGAASGHRTGWGALTELNRYQTKLAHHFTLVEKIELKHEKNMHTQ